MNSLPDSQTGRPCFNCKDSRPGWCFSSKFDEHKGRCTCDCHYAPTSGNTGQEPVKMQKPIVITPKQIAIIFDEWQRRFESNPHEFDQNAQGGTDYGQACADYFIQLYTEFRGDSKE